MTEDNGQRTIRFEDQGALDTFIAMSDLTDEEAETLRENVEQFGFGTPVPLPTEPEDDEI